MSDMVQDEGGGETDTSYKVTWYKVGKGKKALPALGTQKYDAIHGHGYHILHISGKTILGGLMYADAARAITKELLVLDEALLADDWQDRLIERFRFYLRYYQEHYATKKVMGFTEFSESVEYEQQVITERSRVMACGEATKHLQELHDSNQSLAYVPDSDGNFIGSDLRHLHEGRLLPGQGVSPLDEYYKAFKALDD